MGKIIAQAISKELADFIRQHDSSLHDQMKSSAAENIKTAQERMKSDIKQMLLWFDVDSICGLCPTSIDFESPYIYPIYDRIWLLFPAIIADYFQRRRITNLNDFKDEYDTSAGHEYMAMINRYAGQNTELLVCYQEEE